MDGTIMHGKYYTVARWGDFTFGRALIFSNEQIYRCNMGVGMEM